MSLTSGDEISKFLLKLLLLLQSNSFFWIYYYVSLELHVSGVNQREKECNGQHKGFAVLTEDQLSVISLEDGKRFFCSKSK